MKQLAQEEANDGTTGSTSGGAVEQVKEALAQVEEANTELLAKQDLQASPATEAATSPAAGVDEGAAAPAASDPAPTGPQFTPGAVALITKGLDRHPVQLRDQAHLDELVAAHGGANVEVQS